MCPSDWPPRPGWSRGAAEIALSAAAGRLRRPGPETAGLLAAWVLLVAGLVLDRFMVSFAVFAGACIFVMTIGSSFRTMLLAFGMQILLSLGELEAIQSSLRIPFLRLDELLLLWSVFLWMVAVADGRGGTLRRGSIGSLITAFILIVIAGSLRGLASGYPRPEVFYLSRTYLGYLVFFPAFWLMQDRKRNGMLMSTLLALGIGAGVIFLVKGLTRSGEGVYFFSSSGMLRIVSRQPNAFGVILMLLVTRLWIIPRSLYLPVAIPGLVVMAIGLLLCGTRTLWGGGLLAIAVSWILVIVRGGGVPGGRRRQIWILVVVGALIALTVYLVSALGIITTSQMASRFDKGAGTGLPFDLGLLSRLLSWSAVIETLGPGGLLLGRGIGATITYFKPEWGALWTMNFVDGTFWQVLLNLGLVGVAVLAALYISGMVQAAGLFLRTADLTRAATALGIFCALLFLSFASMMSSLLTNYSYTALWAMLFALLQVEVSREAAERKGVPG